MIKSIQWLARVLTSDVEGAPLTTQLPTNLSPKDMSIFLVCFFDNFLIKYIPID